MLIVTLPKGFVYSLKARPIKAGLSLPAALHPAEGRGEETGGKTVPSVISRPNMI